MALHATRLVLPRASGPAAFLYSEELVFACSTGTGRGGLPEEKLSFNSPGESTPREATAALWFSSQQFF